MFYADRLSEADRYLLAALSLFARPVPADAVLAVAQHEMFGDRLAGRTPVMVQAAIRDRLSGLASWHPDGTISAHPLVRDTFRPLAMDAAEIAADTSLAGLPTETVTSRADALRVVEAIELLLDAGQWAAADDLHRIRCLNGEIWINLPAARLGQRAATAFVATPTRRNACDTELGRRGLSFYVNEAGLFAMIVGDATSAEELFLTSIQMDHDADDMTNEAIGLQNLAECLTHLGQIGPAQEAATEAHMRAKAADDPREIRDSYAYLAWVSGLAGETVEAERHFSTADQLSLVDDDAVGDHMGGASAADWAEWLVRTGRSGPARKLTDCNAEICERYGWNSYLALNQRLMGRLALAAGDTITAGERLTAAVTCFRDGDYLIELATTLVDLASCAQATGDLDTAERYVTEAIGIASPRGLVPTQSDALAARARVRAGQASITADPDLFYQGRDAADAALRLAVRHHLAWHELGALRAHADLDQAEGTDHGWAARGDALHARLVPPGLDPDPLATVERLVAAEKAAGQSAEDGQH